MGMQTMGDSQLIRFWMGRAGTIFLLVTLLILPSCDKEEPEHPNVYVNNWILTNMDYWYYWSSSLPENPDKSQEHDVFFESLLNSQDRFSWIQENFQDLINSLQGVNKEAGYELALYRESPDNINVIGQVAYIKPGSPAEVAGIKRGDLITRINNEQLTISNFQRLLAAVNENHSVTFKALDLVSQIFGAEQSKDLTTVLYAENPNFLNKVLVYNDRKIGYYVYNLFSTGQTKSSTQYTNEMDQIFASFQSAGITDLILDLRFNSGGAETATINLASLIGKDIDNTKVFSFREYNSKVTAEIMKDPQLGEGFLSVEFLSKAQNIGNQLRNNRVYILTGSRTASASELLINGLRPYMDVFLIGATTVGKNVGSITLNEANDPRNSWGMQPIITKSFNSLKQSEYDTGFIPQIELEDNSLIVYPLGDPRERLLNRALQEITGLTDVGRVRASKTLGKVLGHSLDLKKRSNLLIIDPTIQNTLRAQPINR
jgi:carboxyl-terminal processing protease